MHSFQTGRARKLTGDSSSSKGDDGAVAAENTVTGEGGGYRCAVRSHAPSPPKLHADGLPSAVDETRSTGGGEEIGE